LRLFGINKSFKSEMDNFASFWRFIVFSFLPIRFF